ncbi:MAG TPA: oligosaccharide flippase family protein [Vicinamibacteria bacterium]|nr:oligosaccharide flippase family protein [Vicinamibacteria bacterium]
MSSTESTVKPALVLMMGRGVALMATFLAPLILVRLFDQTEFGTYKQVFLVYVTLYVLSQLGLAESLFYFIPRATGGPGGYVANSMLALAGTGLASLGLLWATAPALARWLGNPELARYLPLLGVFLALMLPSTALEIVMISRRRYIDGAVAYGVSDVLRALAFVVPALVWHGLRGLLIGAAVFAAARLGASLIYLRRELGPSFRPQAARAWEQLAYALPFALTVLVDTVQLNYHQYAVAHRFDAATFAIYAVGCFQIPLLDLVASPMSNVMMVRMAERLRDGQPDEALAVCNRTTRTLALVFFPVLALLLVAARDLIVLLFTDRYLASVPIFMICSFTLLSNVLQTDAMLRVYAATRFMLAVGLMKLLMIATLIGAFMAAFGLPGAALVWVIAMLAMKGVVLARMKRSLRVGLGRLVPWRDLAIIASAATAATLPAVVVKAAVEGPVLARLALTVLAGGVAYVLIVWQSGVLDADERLAVRTWLQRFTPAAVQAGESRS